MRWPLGTDMCSSPIERNNCAILLPLLKIGTLAEGKVYSKFVGTNLNVSFVILTKPRSN